LSTDIAARVRSNWATEIDTETADDELVALLLLVLVLEEEEEEELLLQAAAARHRASDADVTTAPFLTIRIIKTTLRLKEGPSGHIQACGLTPRPGGRRGHNVSIMTLERQKLT
jgi:hypothetical protein